MILKLLFEYSDDMQDAYKNIAGNNPGKKLNILLAIEDLIADMIKKLIQ